MMTKLLPILLIFVLCGCDEKITFIRDQNGKLTHIKQESFLEEMDTTFSHDDNGRWIGRETKHKFSF